MSPELIGAGVGLVGSLFGGGQPSYVENLYKMYTGMLRRGINLYDQTNLESIDNQALGLYREGIEEDAMQYMRNYDAQGAAGPGGIKDDTNNLRAKSLIGYKSARLARDKEAELLLSRPHRKASLLPNAGAAAGGFNMAAHQDAVNFNERSGMTGAIAKIAGILQDDPQQFGTRKYEGDARAGAIGGKRKPIGYGPGPAGY